MERIPTHVVVKLDTPVGPDDAQELAEHIVRSLDFSDVDSAQPAYYDYDEHGLVLAGEKVSS